MHWILQHPLSRLLEFVVGVACGRYFLRTQSAPPRLLAAYPTRVEGAVLALVVAGLLASTWAYGQLNQAAGGWLLGPGTATWCSQIGTFPAFALAILVFAYSRGRVSKILGLPIFVLLGEISYSTYMLHQTVLAFAVKYALTAKVGLPLTLALVILVTYAASYAAWRWVENPARRWLVRTTPPAPRAA
jgi:peptidoglycan/LPS O-acetylase OafA/YrhL